MKAFILPILIFVGIFQVYAEDITIKYLSDMSEVTCLAATKDSDYTIGGQSSDGFPRIDCWGGSFTADNAQGNCIAISQYDLAISCSNGIYGTFSPFHEGKFMELTTCERNNVISFNDIADDGSIAVGNMENSGRKFPFVWTEGLDIEIYVPEEITERPGYVTVEMAACSSDGKRALGNILYEDGRWNFIILDKTSGYNEYPSFDFNPAGDNKINDLKEIGSIEFNELTATAMSQDGNWIAVAVTVVNPVDGRTKLTGRYDIRNNELYIATLYPEGDYTFIPVGIDNNGTVVGRMTCYESQNQGQEINHAWVWEKGSDTVISTLSQSFNREISAELENLDRYSNRPYGITMSEDGDSEYIFGSFTDEKGMKSGYVIEIKGIGTSVDVISNDKDSSALEFYDTSGRRLNLESISDIAGSIYKRHGNKIVILH